MGKVNKEISEATIIDTLKTIYDPEIPINIYDLGLIYEVEFYDTTNVKIIMTLTAPNCPMADQILQEVDDKINTIPEIDDVTVILTFEPPWDKDMMSEEAKLELGFI